MIRAGRLTETILLQRETEVVKPSGHVSRSWVDLATVRAEIKTLSAIEYLRGFGETDAGELVFQIRWRPQLDLSLADRVVHRGQVYDLKAVVEIGPRRALELRCVRSS